MDTMQIIITVIIWGFIVAVIRKDKKKKGQQNVRTISEGIQPGKTPIATRNAYKNQINSNAGKKPTSAEAVNAVKRQVQESTTDYLNRKAKRDEIEHRKEALEQKREEQKNYGRINYAQRWYEGDPIPESRKLVKCSYCGAENLIPTRGGKNFNCYFCREEL